MYDESGGKPIYPLESRYTTFGELASADRDGEKVDAALSKGRLQGILSVESCKRQERNRGSWPQINLNEWIAKGLACAEEQELGYLLDKVLKKR